MPCTHTRRLQHHATGAANAFSTASTRARHGARALNGSPRAVRCRAWLEDEALCRRALLGLGLLLPLARGGQALAADAEGTVRLVDPRQAERLSAYQRQVLEFNQRVQRQNNCPPGFPSVIRDKFDLTVVAEGFDTTPEGLIYKDFKVGDGRQPEDGEQVTFAYTAYNESGGLIDSTYRQGRDAQTQLGIGGMIPGFEVAVKGMKVGGQRRAVVPPDLGPPVGPSTFFSAKQIEVFDIELLGVKSCRREGALMFSRVVCE